MKKPALLAVSALSLGVVGLATFTPLTYAATTQDATITVTVSGQIGIGNEDGSALSNMNVNYTLSANDVRQDQTRTIKTTNNTASNLTLTVKSKEGDASLTGTTNPENKIPAGTNIKAGTSAWGIKGGDLSNWTAVPAASAGGLEIGNDADRVDGVETFDITYGVSTNATQPVDTYTDVITYTVSPSN